MNRNIGFTLVALLLLSMTVISWAAAEVTIDLRLPNAVDVVLYGNDAFDYFGCDLATGDINGDGIADLAMGAPLGDGPNGNRDKSGEVHVYYGRPETDWRAGDVSPNMIVYGPRSNRLGGDYMREPGHTAIGDIDNDGIDDLVVAAPEFGRNGAAQNRGRVWIIWGGQGLPDEIDLESIPPDLDVTIIAPPDAVSSIDWVYLGAAVAVGDLNGDGVGDVAMSAPLDADNAGTVYVLFGSPHLRDRNIWIDDVPEDISVLKIIGETSGSPLESTKLGSFLTFGDLSGDGIDDFIISAEHDQADRGTVHVVFGGDHLDDGLTWDFAKMSADWSAEAQGSSAGLLGRSLATGDFNADSQVDLLLGAPAADGPTGQDVGQGIGVFGPLEDGVVRDLDDAPGDLIVYGPQPLPNYSYLGGSVTIGDFNDDNVGDLFIGARQADGLGRDGSGIVYLFYGDSELEGILDLQQSAADITMIGAYPDDRVGYVTHGDIDGDGTDDMITSAINRPGPTGAQYVGAVYVLFGSEQPPTPIPPTATPTAAPTATRTPIPTVTPTITPTISVRYEVQLPLILRSFAASP